MATWITPGMRDAYVAAVHRLGFAHSVEVWHDRELAGGVYGVAVGLCSPPSRCSTACAMPRRWPCHLVGI